MTCEPPEPSKVMSFEIAASYRTSLNICSGPSMTELVWQLEHATIAAGRRSSPQVVGRLVRRVVLARPASAMRCRGNRLRRRCGRQHPDAGRGVATVLPTRIDRNSDDNVGAAFMLHHGPRRRRIVEVFSPGGRSAARRYEGALHILKVRQCPDPGTS
jgi:hypothetical protein